MADSTRGAGKAVVTRARRSLSTGGLSDCIGIGEDGTGRMKLNPSVEQSGDVGEGKTNDGGVATELEDDELGGGELEEASGHELDSMP